MKTPENPESEFDKNLIDFLTRYSMKVGELLNGGLKFTDNFNAAIVTFTSGAVADAEETVAHSLGRVPIGFLVLHREKAAILYQGPSTGTAWTATAIYVKSNVASTAYKILIF